MRNLNQKHNLEDAVLELISTHGADAMGELIRMTLNRVMEAERASYLEAEPYERIDGRKDYANGFKPKNLTLSTGKIKVDVPQVRKSGFRPKALEIGSRSERALKLAIAELYVQGVSTRNVTKVTEALCGLEITSGQVSRLAKELDEDLEEFRNRPLSEFPIVYLDAHYQKVRHGGSVIDLAVLIAVGVNRDGKREILGVSAKLSEAEVHWRDFLEDLVSRGLRATELIISDDHAGLKAARKRVFPGVKWQRCIFHLAKNAQHHCPKKAMAEEIGDVVRSIYNQPDRHSAQRQLSETVEKYREKAPDFSEWLESNGPEGFTFYDFPKECWRKIKTSNVVERLNREVKRRTRVVNLFPNEPSCLRLVSALLHEQHEEWCVGRTYIKMTNWEK